MNGPRGGVAEAGVSGARPTLVLVATPLVGCGHPEGYGTIDVEAARREAAAKGLPDPLAPPVPPPPKKVAARRR